MIAQNSPAEKELVRCTVDKLKACLKLKDKVLAENYADEALCFFLHCMGHTKVVKKYRKVKPFSFSGVPIDWDADSISKIARHIKHG